jgi:poly-gamma-glutamate synthesis protein (capsule biosynthesis protein)
MSEAITVAFIGDVMLGRGVNEEIARRSPASFWGNVLPLLRSLDGVIANLECALTFSTQKCTRTPKVFYFRADPAAVDVLRAANIRCVSLANNHILDFDDQGLLDTLDCLNAAGIRHVGAGQTIEEAIAPAVIEMGNLKIGIIALTDNEPSFAADSTHPGVNYRQIRSDPETLGKIQNAVAQVRQAGVSLVVLSAHWGPNMVVAPSPRFRTFARAALECGVDLFHGHSAHLFQGIELYKHGVILYDTGDFLDDYAVDPILRNDWSFVFVVDVDTKGIQRLQLVPVRLHFARVELAGDEEFKAICDRMQMLCQEFNTPILQTSEGLEIKLRS